MAAAHAICGYQPNHSTDWLREARPNRWQAAVLDGHVDEGAQRRVGGEEGMVRRREAPVRVVERDTGGVVQVRARAALHTARLDVDRHHLPVAAEDHVDATGGA